MSNETPDPITLGDKLITRSKGSSTKSLSFILVLLIAAVPLVWFFYDLGLDLKTLLIIEASLIVISYILVVAKSRTRNHGQSNFLITGDTLGFMQDLQLAEKTAVFDGSNIYHFGLHNDVAHKVLATLVNRLRSDGYRIVCFFDANIYFTMRENDAFQHKKEMFSVEILKRIFDLKINEIYVVPSGEQADRFILESLIQLPVSFAVTNDQFRDYQKDYELLLKDNQWRKGVKIKNGELLLYQYKFKPPLIIQPRVSNQNMPPSSKGPFYRPSPKRSRAIRSKMATPTGIRSSGKS